MGPGSGIRNRITWGAKGMQEVFEGLNWTRKQN